MEILIRYIVTLLVFFSIDIIWLSVVARNLYKKELGDMLAKNPNWIAAIIFYLLYIAGIVIFAVNFGIEKQSLKVAVVYGGLLGLIAYATYDLTNLATLKDWPLKITIIDLIWGTLLTATTAGIAYTLTAK